MDNKTSLDVDDFVKNGFINIGACRNLPPLYNHYYADCEKRKNPFLVVSGKMKYWNLKVDFISTKLNAIPEELASKLNDIFEKYKYPRHATVRLLSSFTRLSKEDAFAMAKDISQVWRSWAQKSAKTDLFQGPITL